MAKRIGRPRDLNEALDTAKKLPTYARLVWALARDRRVPAGQKAVLAGIAVYLVSPLDLIPAFIPVIGELSDVGVLLVGLDWFIRNAPADVVAEHMAKIAAHDDTLSHDLASAGSVLHGRANVLRATLERIRSMRERGGDDER